MIRERKEEKDKGTRDVFQVPSHARTFKALNIVFKWFERQDECDSIEWIQPDQGLGCNKKV